jgi:ssDNA-binding replication factor A large subunit
MENQPQNIIAIGRKRIPIEEIALVEPFEPPAEQPPRLTSHKDFKARVVLIDRYRTLTRQRTTSTRVRVRARSHGASRTGARAGG